MLNGFETAVIYFVMLVCTLAVLALVLQLCSLVGRILLKLNIIQDHEPPFITPQEAEEHRAVAAVAALHHFNHTDHSAIAAAAAAALNCFHSSDLPAIAVAAAAASHKSKE